MRQGIKEKDIRDFEKYARKLSDVVERIREYRPDARGFMNQETMCLMSCDWCEIDEPNDVCVASVTMPSFDAGAW